MTRRLMFMVSTEGKTKEQIVLEATNETKRYFSVTAASQAKTYDRSTITSEDQLTTQCAH